MDAITAVGHTIGPPGQSTGWGATLLMVAFMVAVSFAAWWYLRKMDEPPQGGDGRGNGGGGGDWPHPTRGPQGGPSDVPPVTGSLESLSSIFRPANLEDSHTEGGSVSPASRPERVPVPQR